MSSTPSVGSNTQALWDAVTGARVFDLSHCLDVRAPVSPQYPGFRMALLRRHGEELDAEGCSVANELLVFGSHCGTHLDALCHVAHRGRLHRGHDALAAQRGGRFRQLGVETIQPVLGRGVLLDIARLHGCDTLPGSHVVTAAELEAAAVAQDVDVRQDDVVLIRTGWSAYWSNPDAFLAAATGSPGPDVPAARWLVEKGVRLTGGETVAYEYRPPGDRHALPVHRLLLVEHGMPILEALNLTELAAAGAWEFLFVMTPLRLAGATGSPVRPLAILRP